MRIVNVIISIFVVFQAQSLRIAETENSNNLVNYSEYQHVLEKFVSHNGINYQRLKSNPTNIRNFVRYISTLNAEIIQSLNIEHKVAFWTNVYNALTISYIVDNYPIKPHLFRQFIFPVNSVRQFPGMWDTVKHVVAGVELTLDQIEHAKLRGELAEPRIHIALNCGAKDCPPLYKEPYLGEKLNNQLDEQLKIFIKSGKAIKIDRVGNIVSLSSIFDWFGEDFLQIYYDPSNMKHIDSKQNAVLNFLVDQLSMEDAAYLKTKEYEVEFLKYDWSLNDAS